MSLKKHYATLSPSVDIALFLLLSTIGLYQDKYIFMQEIDLGPFYDGVELYSAIREYEDIRLEGKTNMFGLTHIWSKEELEHIMELYNTGVAQMLLKANAD